MTERERALALLGILHERSGDDPFVCSAGEARALWEELEHLTLVVERLRVVLDEYADHQSWRCQWPDRYPHTPDCPCGLVTALAAVQA